MNFIEKSNYRQDINLMKTMELTLDRLKKRDEIDRETEKAFIKNLQDKEIEHKNRKSINEKKTVEELKMIRKKQKELQEEKQMQSILDSKRFKELANDKKSQRKKEIRHKRYVDMKHKEMVIFLLNNRLIKGKRYWKNLSKSTECKRKRCERKCN